MPAFGNEQGGIDGPEYSPRPRTASSFRPFDTARQDAKLFLITLWGEVLEQGTTRKCFLGLLSNQAASAYFAALDTPLHLVIGLEANRLADGLWKGQAAFLVHEGCIH